MAILGTRIGLFDARRLSGAVPDPCAISPVGDAYAKAGLATAPHRTAMCRAAVSDSSWIDVDPFEAQQDEYQRHVSAPLSAPALGSEA